MCFAFAFRFCFCFLLLFFLFVFFRSWLILGLSWPLLGRSWSFLGRSWAALGRSVAAFARLLATLGPLLGRSWNDIQKSPKSRCNKKTYFGFQKGSQREPKSSPKRTNIDDKKRYEKNTSPRTFWSRFATILDRFVTTLGLKKY